ncbi:MAG: hypothetical protein PVG48_01390 [Candidatus Bathyarchaeota archaeon]|jgi:hypothetical protein
MSPAKIVQKEIEQDNKHFSAVYLETRNAGLILLSEGEDQLGTLAVAIPQKQKMVGPPLSSILLGDRNVITARLFAERLAQKMNKIGLASIFIKSISEREAGPILVKLFEKTMKKEENKK